MVAGDHRAPPRHPLLRERTPALASHTDTPEFSVTGADGKAIATFTITTDGEVNSTSEVVTDMITSMIQARYWAPEQAALAFTDGWSNGYVSITRRPH
jgi:hypothetical protein